MTREVLARCDLASEIFSELWLALGHPASSSAEAQQPPRASSDCARCMRRHTAPSSALLGAERAVGEAGAEVEDAPGVRLPVGRMLLPALIPEAALPSPKSGYVTSFLRLSTSAAIHFSDGPWTHASRQPLIAIARVACAMDSEPASRLHLLRFFPFVIICFGMSDPSLCQYLQPLPALDLTYRLSTCRRQGRSRSTSLRVYSTTHGDASAKERPAPDLACC